MNLKLITKNHHQHHRGRRRRRQSRRGEPNGEDLRIYFFFSYSNKSFLRRPKNDQVNNAKYSMFTKKVLMWPLLLLVVVVQLLLNVGGFSLLQKKFFTNFIR